MQRSTARRRRPSPRTRATAYPNRLATPFATLHDLVENDNYSTAEVINPWADAVAVD